MSASAHNILALDVGSVRIGVARVNMVAKLPQVLPTLANNERFAQNLSEIIAEYEIDNILVGLPRNMEGAETAQTAYVRQFCQDVLDPLGVPYEYIDETLTSVVATQELESKGAAIQKGDVDAQAAAILLNDYIESHEIQ